MMNRVVRERRLNFRPSRVARRLYWHALDTVTGIVAKPQYWTPYVKPGANILWLESGRAEMKLESGTYLLRPGYVWVYSLQQSRQYRPWECDQYTVSTIRFCGPNLDAWLEELNVKRNPEFVLSSQSLIYKIQRALRQVAVHPPLNWEQQIHSLLSQLLLRLVSLRKPPGSSRDLPLPISKVFDAVSTDPDRAWKPSDLATLAGISYRRLRALFHNTLNESIHAFLQQQRLDRARILLAEGKLSVKEIAEKLHFGNEFYFSSFFKTRTGYSPTNFRKHLGFK